MGTQCGCCAERTVNQKFIRQEQEDLKKYQNMIQSYNQVKLQRELSSLSQNTSRSKDSNIKDMVLESHMLYKRDESSQEEFSPQNQGINCLKFENLNEMLLNFKQQRETEPENYQVKELQTLKSSASNEESQEDEEDEEEESLGISTKLDQKSEYYLRDIKKGDNQYSNQDYEYSSEELSSNWTQNMKQKDLIDKTKRDCSTDISNDFRNKSLFEKISQIYEQKNQLKSKPFNEDENQSSEEVPEEEIRSAVIINEYKSSKKADRSKRTSLQLELKI